MEQSDDHAANVRTELERAGETMVELREWRVALAEQTRRMREARESLEQHRKQGRGANRR